MEQLGNEFNATGSVMSKAELEESRRKRGECVTCGRKCYQKKLFKMIPITDHGRVLNGRCLNCKPLEAKEGVLPAVARPATVEDLQRFTRSQSNLAINGRSVPLSGSSNSGQGVERAPVRRSRSSRGSSAIRSSSSGPPQGHGEARERPVPHRAASMHLVSGPAAHLQQAVISGSATSLLSEATGSSHVSQEGSGRSVPVAGTRSSIRRTRSASITGGTSQPLYCQNNSQYLAQNLWSNVETENREMSASAHSVSSWGSSTSGSPYNDGQEVHIPLSSHMYNDNGHEPHSTSLSAHLNMMSAQASQRISQRDFDSARDSASLDEVASLPTIPNRPISGVMAFNSSRSLNSNEEMYPLPIRQGILDRGGQFSLSSAFANGTSNTDLQGQVNPFLSGGRAESNRTLSSMSSVEEDAAMNNGSTGRRYKNSPEQATPFYEDEASECSAPSIHSVRSGTTVSTRTPAGDRVLGATERIGLERLRRAGSDYTEIILTMSDYSASSFLQQEGLKDLSNLLLSEQDQDSLADLGALELIVSAMRNHPNEVELQICGCRAVWNLSATPTNQVGLVQAGALDALLGAMEEFLDEPEVQEKAMAALSNLGAAEVNLDYLIDKGAVGRIVEAMNRHSEDARVQVKGCTAIINLASHDSPIKRRILEAGAGGAVVVSMVMHPEHSDLQEKALRAIRNLCANNDENKVDLANIGGVDAVIRAMQVHRDEAGVQEAGAWALSNLALDPGNRAVIGDSGGIDVVIRAMWVHSDHPGVQEWCCRALWTLAGDPQNRSMIMEVGGISAVINAMQAHVDEGAVQEKGCAVLDALAADTDSKLRIVNEEALDAIVLAMVLHADDSLVQQRALAVLCRLAIKENMKPMQAANANELAKVAAEKFPDSCEAVASQLLGALEAF